MSEITLEKAREAVSAGIQKSKELGFKMNIAIVDAGAHLKAFARMDGALLGSIDIAIKKAVTAKLFEFNSGEIGKMSQPGAPYFNIEHSNGGLITFPGGIPIRTKSGEVVGAAGVSGSTVENDQIIAEVVAKVAGT